MDREKRRDEYLAQAKAADEKAARAANSDTKEIWRQVADSYRFLARYT